MKVASHQKNEHTPISKQIHDHSDHFSEYDRIFIRGITDPVANEDTEFNFEASENDSDGTDDETARENSKVLNDSERYKGTSSYKYDSSSKHGGEDDAEYPKDNMPPRRSEKARGRTKRDLDTHQLFLLFPSVLAFALQIKQWGEFLRA